MKVIIDEICTACGLCADTCPDVFCVDCDRVKVIANPVPPEQEDIAQHVSEECPVEAIFVE